MAETIAQSLVEFFGDTIPAELTIFIISLLPIVELRGGIIAAKLLGVGLVKAFIICYIANLIPVPFLILFIKKLSVYLKRIGPIRRVYEHFEKKAEKNRDKILRYKQWGLLVFVAIPLPGTGAWTGSILASLLEIPLKKAFPIIALGVFIAGLIMSLLMYGVIGSIFGAILI